MSNMNKCTTNLISKILIAPYNIGLIAMSALLWVLCCLLGYWNANFDMLSTIETYIIGLGLISVLIGGIGDESKRHLLKLGVITQIIGVFALVTSKSLAVSVIGIWLLTPISFFCFFLVLKNLWLITENKSEKGK
jgi:hypothetical protein